MTAQEFRIKKNQRVSLRGDCSDLYLMAHAGSQGWVRDRKLDNMGYPFVFIEWDRDHWTYNGEKDRWAYESHFDVVEEKMADIDKDAFAAALAALAHAAGVDEPSASPGLPDAGDDDIGDSPQTYQRALDEGAENASDAQAFFMITMRQEPHPETGDPVFIPDVHQAYQSEAAGLMLESQMARLVAFSYELLATREARKLLKK